ncbi:hypothetical protein B0A48_05667 [Cryoendolithus antarcticus]|uniref:Uncharacterized protein n=1 Tax=Cryoendolithus antarcticus TaxID=1507870 RepID=A0A1V8TBI6_9PEZI|nr:hypothetical protein B0A48_05667 [Cryoendolithus antarcticus]
MPLFTADNPEDCEHKQSAMKAEAGVDFSERDTRMRSHAAAIAETTRQMRDSDRALMERAGIKCATGPGTDAEACRQRSEQCRSGSSTGMRVENDDGTWLFSPSDRSMVLVWPASEENRDTSQIDAVEDARPMAEPGQLQSLRSTRSRSPRPMGTDGTPRDPSHELVRSHNSSLDDAPPAERQCTAELAVRGRNPVHSTPGSTDQRSTSRKDVGATEHEMINLSRSEARRTSSPSMAETHLMWILTEAFHPDKLFADRYDTPSSTKDGQFLALHEQWRYDTHVMFSKPSGYANLRVFPTPPAQRQCHKAACQALQRSDRRKTLGLCDCQIQRAFSGLSKVALMGELAHWNPDRFTLCAEEVREDLRGKAVRVIAVISDMYGEARDDNNILV